MTKSLMVCGLVFGFAAAICGGEIKVGVVDVGRALRAHPDASEMDQVLEKQLAEMETHRDSMLAEQEKMKKAFETARDEALNKALSEAGREERMGVAQQKLAELTEFTQKARQTAADERKDLAERKARMQRRIVDKIRDSVKVLAAARGIEIVLDSSGLGVSGVETVLFSAETVDLTDAVIAAISASKSATAGQKDGKEDAPAKAGGKAPAGGGAAK